MKTYQHTQPGKLIVLSMLAVLIVEVILGVTAYRPILAITPVFLIAGWLFHSLTIEVSKSELSWAFGPGLIRKRIRIEDISAAEAVRTTLLEGWGIHYCRFGWLYNVSGYDAVAIRLKNGKRFALGTDEPEALVAAVRTTARL
jgi:hypothetical protein